MHGLLTNHQQDGESRRQADGNPLTSEALDDAAETLLSLIGTAGQRKLSRAEASAVADLIDALPDRLRVEES